ncbi:MAG: EamA family transporter [Candidatus Margulisbacteria bacterium]|nr:EamA family transporter [Candidatus Margulisiibacteriota bacterium]MBU1617434.1 EamA family transporter [Candidatus Margulisiibacteriota bacterium]MBU1867494.1 EamA family transporter [Candidatus Margulisiibacteriota bacterium]
MGNYLILIVSVLLAVTGQLMMKKGMVVFGAFPFSQILVKLIPIFMNPWVFFGFVCFGLSSIFWLVVLSRLPLSLVYPMVSVAYVLVALASMLFFREPVSLVRWIGISVIILGVILISRS